MLRRHAHPIQGSVARGVRRSAQLQNTRCVKRWRREILCYHRPMLSSINKLPRFRESPDLATLIELYEGNYVRMMRLAPELGSMRGTTVSRVAGALDLYLSIDEQFKYTTSLLLTYRFPQADEIALEPRARIHVYHDVRAAEVVSHYRRRRSRRVECWRYGHMPEVQRRWSMNRFLNKWLRFCAHQGHLFLNCTTSRAPDPRLELTD